MRSRRVPARTRHYRRKTMGRPLKIAKAQAVVTLTATNGTTEVVTTSANFTNLGIIAGMPFIPASSVGNLVAGTTYWILQVINAGNNSTFTVSATELSANPTYTPFNLGTTAAQSVALTIGVVDAYFNNPVSGAGYPATNTATYGVVGGNTAIYGKQTLVRTAIGQAGTGTLTCDTGNTTVTGTGTAFNTQLAAGSVLVDSDGSTIGFVDSVTNATELELAANALVDVTDGTFVFATNEAGYIVRQKGKTKYLVTGTTTGLTAPCYTANVANAALTPNTFNILATLADASTKYVESLSDYNSEVFPAQVAAGSLVIGTVYTIYSVGTTNWTAVGAFANMTGITFTATAAGSGTGTAVLATVNPDVIASFNAAAVANADASLPPVVTISNA
jgi:hypothetical protein